MTCQSDSVISDPTTWRLRSANSNLIALTTASCHRLGTDVVGEARQDSSYWKEGKESRAGGVDMDLPVGQEPDATLPQA